MLEKMRPLPWREMAFCWEEVTGPLFKISNDYNASISAAVRPVCFTISARGMPLFFRDLAMDSFSSALPWDIPSAMPSALPLAVPSARPSALPSARPSALPSARPSVLPLISANSMQLMVSM